jgi:multiple sugar transport system permease protein
MVVRVALRSRPASDATMKPAMIARIARTLVACSVLALIAWSFFDVGARIVERRADRIRRPVTLTVVHWGAPSEDKIVADLCAAYVKEHPNVKIDRINPGVELTREKLETMIAAGDAPDVFYLSPDQLARFARLGLVKPLDAYVANEPPGWFEGLFPGLRDAFRFDVATGQVGAGPLYALPKDFVSLVMFVNTHLCEAAGIDWRDIQANGWTWERFSSESRKIVALRQRPGFAGRDLYGSYLFTQPPFLPSILWTFGGDYFAKSDDGKPDFRRVALDSPGSQAALDFLVRLRLKERTSYNPTGSIAQEGWQEFLNDNIAFVGPLGRWYVPIFKDIKAFRWDVIPMPHAVAHVTSAFYNGWAMSSAAAQPDEAYKLIRYLLGDEGQIAIANSALAIPSRMSAAHSDAFLHPKGTGDPNDTPIPAHAAQVFLDEAQYMRIAQYPEQTVEWNTIAELGLNRAIQTGEDTPIEAAHRVADQWHQELDSPVRRGSFPPMPWHWVLAVAGLALSALTLVLVQRARRERLGRLDRAQELAGWSFISPWAVGFLTLALGPMVASLLLAVSQWTGLNSLSQAKFVGGANFATLFSYDPTFWRSLRVTAYYVLVGVPVTQVAALALALLMNAKVRGIAVFRTIYFVPSVVSGVALAVLWRELFRDDHGLINELIRPITSLFHQRPPNWFGVDIESVPPVNDARNWGVPAFVIMGLWGVGAGMIIYLAGLKGIPESLYEAARLDGAGAWRRLLNVTLPMLSPIIFYNVAMGMIGSFQIFTQAYVMIGSSTSTRGGPDNVLLFYVVNLYRQAFDYHNMGYASAMAWVLFVIVLALTVLLFRGSRKLVYYEGLKS